MRDRLHALISEQALSRGRFVLASGATTDFFVDMKPVMLDPEGLSLLAETFLEKIAAERADHIGGVAIGALPVVAAICVLSHRTERPLRGFFVRMQAKGHGTGRRVEGWLPRGGEVLLFEDVTTTGGSALIAVEAARAAGARVETLYTVVDRREGAEANLAREGVRLVPLFTRLDFGL